MNTRVALSGIIILCVAVAIGVVLGFGSGEKFDNSSDSVTGDTVRDQTTQSPEQPNSGRPPQAAEVAIYPYIDSVNDTSIGVGIDLEAYGYSNLSYDNLRLCVYNEQGTVLANESVGKIRSPENGTFSEHHMINTTLSEPPKYVIVDHPQLRDDSRVEVRNQQLVTDVERREFLWQSVDYLNDVTSFEFPRTNEVGKCG